MIGIVYVKKDASGSHLLRLDTGFRVQNGYKPGSIIIPYSDYECKILDLPPVAGEDIENAIQYSLRSVYPGPPDETVFDCIIYGKSKKVAVFIAKKEVIESYKAQWPEVPLTVPLYLIHSFVREKENHIILFQEGDYIHAFEFERGSLVRSGGAAKENILSYITEVKDRSVQTGSEARISMIASDSLFDSRFPGSIERIPLSSRRLKHPKSESAFVQRKKKRKRLTLLFFIMGTTLLFGSLIVYQYRLLKKAAGEYEILSARMEGLKPELEKVIQLEKEVEELKEQSSFLREKEPLDVYSLFARLNSITEKDLEIESFLLKDDSFQIEGYSRNPYKLVKRIEEDERFIDMKTYNVQPLPDKGVERFTFSGRFIRD